MPDSPSVPVIDIETLVCGNPGANVVREIGSACEQTGFFYICNHGIEQELLAAWKAAEWFFALPRDQKRQVSRSEDNSRGYYDRELTKNTRDMKEVFDFGFVQEPTLASNHQANKTQDGWNQWPTGIGAGEFRAGLECYFEACQQVAMCLLRAVTSSLEAPVDTLVSDFSPSHSSFLRLNYYPVVDPMAAGENARAADTGHMGVHQHSDAGALTLLAQDSIGGLQVNVGGQWIPVPPIKDTIVVNIGDIVQVWSNDRYKAPKHRVVASTGADRYSLPYFFNPLYSASYEPLPSLLSSSSPARYRAIRWGDFRYRRQHGDYGDYGSEVQISDFGI